MGCTFGEEECEAECERQIGALGKFAKVKFVTRFFRTLSKMGKEKK